MSNTDFNTLRTMQLSEILKSEYWTEKLNIWLSFLRATHNLTTISVDK